MAWEYRVEGKAKIQSLPVEQALLLAKQGDLDALYWATKYHEYSGVKVYCYWQKAAMEAGHAEAITEYIVGFRGIDICKIINDTQTEKFWLTKAARVGYAPAQFELSWLFNSSDKKTDKLIAEQWLDKAVNQEYPRALYKKASGYAHDDPAKAASLVEKILSTGNAAQIAGAATFLGDLYLARLDYPDTIYNPQKAIEAFEIAARKNCWICYLDLFNLNNDGEHVEPNYPEAFFWINELLVASSEMDFLRAEYQVIANVRIAEMLMSGNLGEVDKKTARQHLTDAMAIVNSGTFRKERNEEGWVRRISSLLEKTKS